MSYFHFKTFKMIIKHSWFYLILKLHFLLILTFLNSTKIDCQICPTPEDFYSFTFNLVNFSTSIKTPTCEKISSGNNGSCDLWFQVKITNYNPNINTTLTSSPDIIFYNGWNNDSLIKGHKSSTSHTFTPNDDKIYITMQFLEQDGANQAEETEVKRILTEVLSASPNGSLEGKATTGSLFNAHFIWHNIDEYDTSGTSRIVTYKSELKPFFVHEQHEPDVNITYEYAIKRDCIPTTTSTTSTTTTTSSIPTSTGKATTTSSNTSSSTSTTVTTQATSNASTMASTNGTKKVETAVVTGQPTTSLCQTNIGSRCYNDTNCCNNQCGGFIDSRGHFKACGLQTPKKPDPAILMQTVDGDYTLPYPPTEEALNKMVKQCQVNEDGLKCQKKRLVRKPSWIDNEKVIIQADVDGIRVTLRTPVTPIDAVCTITIPSQCQDDHQCCYEKQGFGKCSSGFCRAPACKPTGSSCANSTECCSGQCEFEWAEDGVDARRCGAKPNTTNCQTDAQCQSYQCCQLPKKSENQCLDKICPKTIEKIRQVLGRMKKSSDETTTATSPKPEEESDVAYHVIMIATIIVSTTVLTGQYWWIQQMKGIKKKSKNR